MTIERGFAFPSQQNTTQKSCSVTISLAIIFLYSKNVLVRTYNNFPNVTNYFWRVWFSTAFNKKANILHKRKSQNFNYNGIKGLIIFCPRYWEQNFLNLNVNPKQRFVHHLYNTIPVCTKKEHYCSTREENFFIEQEQGQSHIFCLNNLLAINHFIEYFKIKELFSKK